MFNKRLKSISNKAITEFYASSQWSLLKVEALIKLENKCYLCNSTEKLSLKHIKPITSNCSLRFNLKNLHFVCNKHSGLTATPLPKANFTGTHAEYIASTRWEKFKIEFKKTVPNWCYCCFGNSSKYRLHVHHVSYARLGNEEFEDCRLVCPSCHKEIHALHNSKKSTNSPITINMATEEIKTMYACVKSKLLAIHRSNLAKKNKKKKAVLRCQRF